MMRRLDELTAAVLELTRCLGARLTRSQMCKRLGVSGKTLTDRVRRGVVPSPAADGKWLLAEVLALETKG